MLHFCLHLLNSFFSELQIENPQKVINFNGFIMETYLIATSKKINQRIMIGLIIKKDYGCANLMLELLHLKKSQWAQRKSR